MSSQAVLRQFDLSSLVREPVRAKSSYVPSPREESRTRLGHSARYERVAVRPVAEGASSDCGIRDHPSLSGFRSMGAARRHCRVHRHDCRASLLRRRLRRRAEHAGAGGAGSGRRDHHLRADLRRLSHAGEPARRNDRQCAADGSTSSSMPTAFLQQSPTRRSTSSSARRTIRPGTSSIPRHIRRIVEEAPCLVVIDEAYSEFAGTSYVDLVDRYPNVHRLPHHEQVRRYWRACGSAMASCPKAMAPHFENIVQPCHNVSFVSSEAAIASLDDLDYLNGIVAKIVASRDELAANLREIPGVEALSVGNEFPAGQTPSRRWRSGRGRAGRSAASWCGILRIRRWVSVTACA